MIIKPYDLNNTFQKIDNHNLCLFYGENLGNASTIAEEIVAKNYSARKVEYLVKSKKGGRSKEKIYNANILRTQEKIENILGLKVNILNKKNNSGRVVIEYKDLEQFELISDLLTRQ